jgi:LBP / BPI / CETP family, C-terminal domain
VRDSFNIGNLDIHLHGGASWLYGIFVNLFKGDIEKAIDKALTEAITQNIDQGLNHVFSTMPLDVVIAHTTEIHYNLMAQPTFATSHLTLPLSGAWSGAPPKSGVSCPISTCPTPAIPDEVSSQQLQLVLSEFVADSAGYVYWKLGKLHAEITDKNIPKWSPVRLNTTSLRYILPSLYAKFPDMAVVLDVAPTVSPSATFSTAGALVDVTGDLQAFALNDTHKELAFTLSGTAKAKGAASLKGEKLMPSVAFLSVDFKVAQSNIGKFNPSVLDTLLNDLLGKVWIAFLFFVRLCVFSR